MRVLIVSQYFWPENFRINDISKLLVKNGVEVSVLTGCPNYPQGKSFDGYKNTVSTVEHHADGYLIYRVPLILRGNGSAMKLSLNYISYVFNGIIFGSRLLYDLKFDLIFVYGTSPISQVIVGIYFKYTRKVKLITWVQDLWPESLAFTGYIKNKILLSLVKKVVSWIYRNNDLLLAQSKDFIPAIENKSGNVKVLYFPNPGETVSSHPSFNGNLDLFLNNGFNIVFAGNFGTVQSLPMVLDAAEILINYDDIRIILIGSGSQSIWLSDEIESRQLNNVLLPGRYSAEAMPAIFNRASALLVSLTLDPVLNLTIPAKLQSYLAAGKPIIASLGGAGAQIVKDAKAGIVCACEDPHALAEAILKLKSMDQEDLENMGSSGRRYYEENFNPDTLVKKLIKIFTEVNSDCKNNNS